MLLNPEGSYVIYILSPEHCEKVQRRLFEMGYYWQRGESEVRYRDSAHRLFLNYDARTARARYITYVSLSDEEWRQRDGLLPITYEDLFEEPNPESPPMEYPTTRYSKWHNQCLAKYIGGKFTSTGTMREALNQLSKDALFFWTVTDLWKFTVKHPIDRPKDFPEELLTEMQRRAHGQSAP